MEVIICLTNLLFQAEKKSTLFPLFLVKLRPLHTITFFCGSIHFFTESERSHTGGAGTFYKHVKKTQRQNQSLDFILICSCGVYICSTLRDQNAAKVKKEEREILSTTVSFNL